jgi:hypothetical protein
MVVSKWNVKRWPSGTHNRKPWRAYCAGMGMMCRCKSFPTWAEAMNYARDEAAL